MEVGQPYTGEWAMDPDGMAQRGKYITDPDYIKTSQRFRYDEMLNDSECSEDYDDDLFFECAEPTRNPWQELEI